MLLLSVNVNAQKIYKMGYVKATITPTEPSFFSNLSFPGEKSVLGFYDKYSESFYTCNYETYREIEDFFIEPNENQMACNSIDFDAEKYYGTLILKGVIDSVAWDSLTFYMTIDKAKVEVKTDEKEIDALYKAFYDKNTLGKINAIIRLVTYDTIIEDEISFEKDGKRIRKPKRTYIKYLRF